MLKVSEVWMKFFEVMCNVDRLLINKKISVDNICGWGFIWPNECLFTVIRLCLAFRVERKSDNSTMCHVAGVSV